MTWLGPPPDPFDRDFTEVPPTPPYPATRMERARWWLGDPDHWAGYISDPVEVSSATVWLDLPGRISVFAWRWKIKFIRMKG